MDSKQQGCEKFTKASQCLRQQKQTILRRWVERARHELPSAKNKPPFALLNSLPDFLDRVADSLEQHSTRLGPMSEVAQEHARQRASLGGYTLDQVQAEYTILRKVLFEVLEECSVLDPDERNIILDFVVEGRVAAAEEFMRIANERVRMSEERLSLAIESAQMGSFDWDINSGELTCSEMMRRLYGHQPPFSKAQIEDFWQWAHPDDRESIRTAIQKSIDDRQSFKAEFRVVWPDQSVHWLLCRGRTYFDPNGKPFRMLGTCVEITERKISEENLKRLHANLEMERSWLEMVLDSVPTAVLLIDAATRRVFFENEASKKLGLSLPRVIEEYGQDSFSVYDSHGKEIPVDQLPRHRVIRGEEIRDFELIYKTPEREIPLLVDGKLLPAAFGQPAVGMLAYRELTHIKETEKALQANIEEQKRAQHTLEIERDLREQFVNTLSHDLKNPLSAAKIAAQLIEKMPENLERAPILASGIIASLNRADKMIEDLLDANRIRAGRGLPMAFEKCDLVEVAEKVCAELGAVHGGRIDRRFPKQLEGYWSCRNLQRMLENLIINAFKYGYSETPVSVAISEKGDEIEISVHNFGDPIRPEDQKHLFDPFTRARSVDSGETKGWGLGLTLVRGVAEAHGGSVKVESKKDFGTTFTVTIPRNARHLKVAS